MTPRTAAADAGTPMGNRLREAMAYRAAGVAVVTTRGADGTDMALTATSFASVSLDPPLALVAMNRTSRFHAALLAARTWAATLLCEEQEGLAACFARPRVAHRPEDFLRWETARAPGGALVFPAGLAALDCVTSTAVPAGGSTLVLGLVTATLPGTGRHPLVYFHRRYRGIRY